VQVYSAYLVVIEEIEDANDALFGLFVSKLGSDGILK
jgi:hypothetical protein